MKGISVRFREVTMHNCKGYAFTQWVHPTKELPKYSDHFVHNDVLINGTIVSEPFVHEDNPCVVVQLQTVGRFERFETIWVGHLG